MISHLPQYIVWKSVPGPGKKPLKVPVNYQTGLECDAHDPVNWTTYDTAVSQGPLLGGAGVGFVLTPADPYVCIDLDACLMQDGSWSPFAQEMINRFPGAGVELSYSGNGLHIWGTASAVPQDHRTRSASVPGLEMYSSGRFVALGRQFYGGDTATDITQPFAQTLTQYLPGVTVKAGDWTTEPVPEWNGPEDDEELVRKMLASKPSANAAFGDGATVVDLWEADVDVLSTAYPSESGDAFNHSAADMALASHLAFWTGKDCERMDRLFRESGLFRDKWDREDYKIRTLTRAAAGCTSVYGSVQPPTEAENVNDLIDALDKTSGAETIKEALTGIARLDPLLQDTALRKIKAQTGNRLGPLRAMLEKQENASNDLGLEVAEAVLTTYYQDGNHLVRNLDGSFWVYNSTYWQRATDEQIKKRIVAIAEKKVDSAATIASVSDQAMKLLIAKQAADYDVLRFAEEPPPVINCTNGELWIGDDGSLELRPHRYDSYLTRCLDVEWDPCATAPTFERALRDIFNGDEELARHFRELMGYAIQPSRTIPAWFLLHGRGANGKTVLMETIQRLVGPDSVVSDRIDGIEGNPFKVGALAGKLLLVDDDVGTGTVLPDGFLKKISERKAMTGEHKFKHQFNFTSCCLPVLLANHMPIVKDLSYGNRRRAHVIPFRVQFGQEEQDQTDDVVHRAADPTVFKTIWTKEMQGVLVLAVEGLQRLLARGKFKQPAACIEAHDQWLAEANPLVTFIAEECETGVGAKQTTSQFYQAYKTWRWQQGFGVTITQAKVTRDLKALGYKVAKSNGERWVYGVKCAFRLIATTVSE